MSAQAGRASRAKSLFTRWTRDPLFRPEMSAAASWIAAHLMDCIAACTLPAWIHSRDQRGAPFYRCALRFLFGCAESQVAFSFFAFHQKMENEVSQLWRAVLPPNKNHRTLLAEHASNLVSSSYEPVNQLHHSSCLASHLLHCSGTARGCALGSTGTVPLL